MSLEFIRGRRQPGDFAYNATQPRHPKGSPAGGQWKKSGQGLLDGMPSLPTDSRVANVPSDATPDVRRAMTASAFALEDYIGRVLDAGDAGVDPDFEEMDELLGTINTGFEARLAYALSKSGYPASNLYPEVVSISGDEYNIQIDYAFKDGATQVGSIRRLIDVGDSTITNDFFNLHPSYQGKGVATEVNRVMETWWADNGISTIYVHANIDIGGYTWAVNGFDFFDSGSAAQILERASTVYSPPSDVRFGEAVKALVAVSIDQGLTTEYSSPESLRSGLMAGQIDYQVAVNELFSWAGESLPNTYKAMLDSGLALDESTGEIDWNHVDTYALAENWGTDLNRHYLENGAGVLTGMIQYAKENDNLTLSYSDDPVGRQIIDMASWAEDGDYPTAYDLATLGRPLNSPSKSQGDKDDTSKARWLGKELMLGSDWNGVKYL